ncbi:hypothetical protein FPOA_00385 [Fusarium poae]|uniref:Uncharacterized protein n=1 Tax=Fusarium poae TaxID=36050 RepID=A0A1B8B143_FUSPO|nr:hypothetical protein FPOA_00385 [Fusarium poae]
MSSSATIPEPNRLFALAPEILFKILKETTQKEQCWVYILTKGRSLCGRKGDYDTMVYTQGAGAQGPRSYPFHHECIFNRPVADGEIDIKDTFDKTWEQDLQANRLRNQLNVYERSLDPHLRNSVKSLCFRIANEDMPFDEFKFLCQHIPVLDKNLMPMLSIPDAIYSGLDKNLNSGACEKRPFPTDVLECQRLKHVMICSSSWESRFDNLVPLVFEDTNNSFTRWTPGRGRQQYSRIVLEERKKDDDIALLNQDWSLFSGLESLCFDFNTRSWHHKQLEKFRCLLANMGKSLKLKTLVVSDFCKGTFEQPDMVALLMTCLQPGGKLHLIGGIPLADL